jgi:hypothetical protein
VGRHLGKRADEEEGRTVICHSLASFSQGFLSG